MREPRENSNWPDGVLGIYKEKGYTSNDVVAKLRGILRTRKMGHTGTLDPEAVGVLPICIGKGTRLVELLTDWEKEYRAVLKLGVVTDTQDLTESAEILHTAPEEEALRISEERFREATARYIGPYDQIPPMFSALKKDGVRLYELARKGIEVERKARRITIHDLELLSFEPPYATIRVRCSKGTYIRTLCHDIGQDLGCGAAMASLVRTQVGLFTEENCLTLDEVQRRVQAGETLPIVSPDRFFADVPAVTVSEAEDKLLSNGNMLSPEALDPEPAGPLPERLRIYRPDGSFAALYQLDRRRGVYKSEKMFL